MIDKLDKLTGAIDLIQSAGEGCQDSEQNDSYKTILEGLGELITMVERSKADNVTSMFKL